MYSRLIRVERPLSPSSPRRSQARKDLLESGTTSGDIEPTENLIEKRAGMLLTKMFETYNKGKASALESVATRPAEENLMENKMIAKVVIKKLVIGGVANKTTSLLKEKEAEMFIWKDIELIIKSFEVAQFVLFLTILINFYRFDSSKKRVPTSGDDDEENELKKRKRKVPKPGTTPKVPDKQKRLKVDQSCYFSDLTEEQLIPLFSEVRKFRFVPCKVYLSYNTDDAKASTREVDWPTPKHKLYTYDLPKDTAHCKVGSGDHQLFGSIQAAGVSLDPASPSFYIFNHKYNDPILVPQLGSLSPHFISNCSIPFCTSVKIAAKLYVATDKVDDVKDSYDYYNCYSGKDPTEQFNDAFEVCNDCAVINFSENFAKRPNGGSGSYTLKGRDGHLKLYYVALKYAVDAALEVVFDATFERTKVAGRIMAYYGKNFDYGCSPAEEVDYKAMLFETEQNEVIKPGKINLMRSVLSVPAQFSLVIAAHLTDSTSGAIILSGVYEFLVPTDGSIRFGCIKGNACSLTLKVDWKLPPFAEETTAKSLYYSELSKKQLFAERSIYAPVSMDEEDYRWSLQEKISKAFSYFLHGTLHCEKGAVSISISTGTKADECDYLCTSVLNIWPELRSELDFEGPKSAGVLFRDGLLCFPQARMLERCVVGGPGFLKFKLSGKWIAKSILKMLWYGIDIWAPRLPMKKTIIIFSRNIAKEMCMDHLRCTILGETLARTLKYSGVCVRQRFHDWDHLDIKSKKMMMEFLIDRFPNGKVNDQAIGELEVLYEESKKRFDEDAEFRNRTQQDWGERHGDAWVQICKISRERYQKVYQRLGVHVKEEDKILHDSYISETKNLLEKQGLTIGSKGDEAIVCEGRKLPLVDLASLRHALEKEKVDRIVHVADIGQREKIEMCITAVRSAGLIVTNHAPDPLSHVGFRTSSKVVNLANLREEAKSRCKAVLVRQGTTLKDKELEHTAEALGYGAVRYAYLKNNRLTNYTLSFTDMFNENMFKEKGAAYLQYTYARICKIKGASSKHIEKLEVETLTLKDGKERELGLHLLRFTEVLGKVCRVLAPHIMCEYLYVLCKKFDKLYSPGWQVESGEDGKLLLCEATKVVMRKCFYLLGITPIYKF